MQRKDPLSKNFATPCVDHQLVRHDYFQHVLRETHRVHKEKTLSIKTSQLRACLSTNRHRLIYLVRDTYREQRSSAYFRINFNFSFQLFNGIFYNKQAKSCSL